MAELVLTIGDSRTRKLVIRRSGFTATAGTGTLSADLIPSKPITGLSGGNIQEKLENIWNEVTGQKVTDKTQSDDISVLKNNLNTISQTVGLTWESIIQNKVAENNKAYISDSLGIDPLQFILPTTASLGFSFRVLASSGKFQITQNASQMIIFGNIKTTEGVNGKIVSEDDGDYIELTCIGPPNKWAAVGVIGNLSFF